MAFNFFKNIFPTKSYLGIDIGTTSIKLIELKKTHGAPELLNYAFLESYGSLERFNDAIQTSTLKMVERETAGLIKILLKNANVKSNDVVASIPTFSAFTTLLEIPLMPDEDISRAMQFQVKQYIPLPVSAVTTDWMKVGERKNDRGDDVQQILLVSVPNEQIQKYKNIFQNIGLNLLALEIEGISNSRALSGGDDKTALIIDIGSRSTGIFIAKNGLLRFSGQTDFAGSSFTQTIAAGLNIRVRRAEDLKKQKGLKGTGGEYELSTLMLPILDVIISEVRRVKINYERGYGDSVEQVILSGGGADLIGIVSYIQEQIELPTAKASPFSQLKCSSELEPFLNDLSPEFTVAIGLGLKPFK